jgi:hypothetical protein
MSIVCRHRPTSAPFRPYIPGKPITELARQMGIPVDKIVKLASNENPLGMSPKARKAVEAALAGVERYPDQFDLIAAMAERHGVSPGAGGAGQRLERRARPGGPGFPRTGPFRRVFAPCLCRLSAGHDVGGRRVHGRPGEELRP